MTRGVLSLGFALVLTVAAPITAVAVAVHGVANNVPYVMAYRPMNTQQQPYAGQLKLNFNNGIISGTYTDISIRPGGPFANAHNLAVNGGLSGSHLRLQIGQQTFRGTMTGDKMSGSATIRGTVYVFEAHPGSPGSGK